ncbi:uncharacterized protein BYT42DRAFT_618677 [Radiomyces spectabilis]|uniref:uncharacterized protein n=1 Tax=Radiomyces spectabilis TaxID=64574 RepID=UPI00221ED1BC|nr:uncharacterized protein BYT42DRAFT_618677 [Radiomyces spectabilis]KAI8365297.1 hypothetical protein BYT42DRAFT_618677 [Radiomyces spectabilis]
MKATFFVTIAAMFVAAVSAAGAGGGGGKRIDVDQGLGGVGSEGRVSGLLNNVLKGGLLADASEGYGVSQDAF